MTMTMTLPSASGSSTRLRAIVDEACAVQSSEQDDALVEELVSTLRRMTRDAALALALDVGHLVVEKLFGGDVTQLRKPGAKPIGLRKLAAHPNLPFSATTLWRSIYIYELVGRLPEIVRHRHIGVAHLRPVLSLPPGEQEEVLRQAVDERWTVQRIELHVAQRKGRPAACQRPSQDACSGIVAHVRNVERSLVAGDAWTADVATLPEEQRRELIASVQRVRAWLDQVVERAKAT